MKVSMSPRFQAAVCMSRTARIWDSSEGDAGVECETAAKKMIAVTAPANKARRNFAGILGSSGIRRNCVCSCKEPAGTRAGLRPAPTKPTAPAARFNEPEPAATNSTAAGQRLAANAAGDNLGTGRDRAMATYTGRLYRLVLTFYCGGRGGRANWVRSNMFISAFILVICFAAMVQFAVFSWRAGLLRTIATEPIGEQAELTAEISRNLLNGKDFADISSLQGLCPDLKNARVNLGSVRVYYSFLKAMNRLGDLVVAPGADGFGGWTGREMALCTRYTAAVLSQRLRSNQELAAEVRSY